MNNFQTNLTYKNGKLTLVVAGTLCLFGMIPCGIYALFVNRKNNIDLK